VTIILQKEQCIGCGSCAAVCGDCFEMEAEGKSHIKNSVAEQDGTEKLDGVETGCVKEAAEVCPVQCIKII